ncbi:hypothetical protein BC827DRAFT_1234072 [Russula dissimulans]|nr:hypothetical protein BC827DRAFT_1234072 [Russula dissimulans]
MTTIFRVRPWRISLECKPEISIATRSIYQMTRHASFSQTPLLANKLIMQLRTILISTGILALATSLTSGGPTPAIPTTEPRKRTSVNHYRDTDYVPWAVLDIKSTTPYQGASYLGPGATISLSGYDEKLKGRKPGAYTWIELLVWTVGRPLAK